MKFQKIIITGGTRGIGRALVDKFLQEDCEIHVIARNFQEQPTDSNLIFHSLDLTKVHEVSSFCENFISSFGVPDLLINNAGSGAFYKWSQFPEIEILNQINLLYTSPVLICRHFLPSMYEEKRGTIVNVSSLATIYPVPFMTLYNSGKSALSAFTQSLMFEYKDFIKIIDLRLGDVRTDFNRKQAKFHETLWSPKMQKAWNKIENQLNESPSSALIAKQILKIISLQKSGVFYGGGAFQSKIAPLFRKFMNYKGLLFLLRQRYFQ